jgi:hypothetical protein
VHSHRSNSSLFAGQKGADDEASMAVQLVRNGKEAMHTDHARFVRAPLVV